MDAAEHAARAQVPRLLGGSGTGGGFCSGTLAHHDHHFVSLHTAKV